MDTLCTKCFAKTTSVLTSEQTGLREKAGIAEQAVISW